MTVADIVKNSKVSHFVLYREGQFHYKTDNDFQFTVPIEDVGNASLLAEDKTLLFMRWIRKQVERQEVEQ